MIVEPYLLPDLTIVLDAPLSREALFERIAETVDSMIPGVKGEHLCELLEAREQQGPTSTPEGVAFPHALSSEIGETLIVPCVVRGGVDFGSGGHPPSEIILAVFGSSERPWDHVRLLARLARLMHTEQARRELRNAADAAELHQRLVEQDRAHA